MFGDTIEILGPDEDAHPRLAPGSLSDFERQVRGDRRLNATARVGWLMFALSGAGPVTMSAANMAAQIGCSPETVKAARSKWVDAGFFEPKRKPGRNRTPSYSRARPPPGFRAQRGERRGTAFRKWVRAQTWADLKVRLAWLLIDMSSASGVAELSLGEMKIQLGAARRHIHRAIGDLVGMGLFNIEPGDSRSRSRYRPNAALRYDPSPTEDLGDYIRAITQPTQEKMKWKSRRQLV
jgi:hypothetical protein